MAAGLTHKQKYNRTVSGLRAMGRALKKLGIPSTYKDWVLKGVYAGKHWNIWYEWGNMSNGESVGMLRVKVDGKKVEPGNNGISGLVAILQPPKDIPELEDLARLMVGDDGSPNLYFVSVKGNCQLVTRDPHVAYGFWRKLSRKVESCLEDRQTGVLCSNEPEGDEPGSPLRWHDDWASSEASLKHEPIPADFEVQPLKPGENPTGKTTCGYCGLSWDDNIPTSWTPVPSGRCPFEYFHIHHE